MIVAEGAIQESQVKEVIWPLFSRVLAGERERGEIYCSNHSLGRPLDRMAEDVAEGLRKWYDDMDLSWREGGWLTDTDEWRANTAKLIGFSRGDCIIPKASAGQGLRAVLNSFDPSKRIRVVATRGEFDSIDFILKNYAHAGRASMAWVEPYGKEGPAPVFRAGDIIAAISDGTDLVVVSLVFFSTGQILQGFEEIVAAAHERGAMVLVDIFHAAGVIPLGIESTGADFAVGGSYKYLRGGPGAAWLAVHPNHLDEQRITTLDTGWFAKHGHFKFSREDAPQRKLGGDAWLESTPPVLMTYQAKSGLEFTLDIGVERIREYSLKKLAHMRAAFSDEGVELFRPDDPENWGAFALMQHPDAANFSERLRENGVNTDARYDTIRFCPDLLNTDEEIEKAAAIVARLL